MSIFKNKKVTTNNCHCNCGCENKHSHPEQCATDCTCACSTDCTCGCQDGKPCTCDGTCTCDDSNSDGETEPERRCSDSDKAKLFSIKHNNIILSSDNHQSIDNSAAYTCNNDLHIDHHESGGNCEFDCSEGNASSNNACGCNRCDNTKIDIVTDNEPYSVNKKGTIITIARLMTSIVLLLLGLFLELPKLVNLIFYIPAFLFAGGEYVYKAVKNILHGKIFDENFLMTIASIGAFCIGEYPEGIAVMLLYSIGEMLQDYAVDKSKRNIAGMLNLKTPFANKLVDGKIVRVATDDLIIGDCIMIASGEKIPVDGTVIDGESFADNSMLNGEYKPARVSVGDNILGGGILKGSAITIQATKLFKDTTASKIIELVQNAQDKKPKTQQFITKFAKVYTPVVVLIALLLALIPPAILGFSAHFSEYLNKALVFLVISCPCALVISVPLGFFAGIGGASKRGILFKGGNYLEALCGIDTFAFDKTGTLTEGTFNVTEISTVSIEKNQLIEICAYAESKSNHPIAESIRKAYKQDIDTSRISNYHEKAGYGITLQLDGINIICGSIKLLNMHNIPAPEVKSSGTALYIAKDNVYCGHILISDTIKPDASAVIAKLLSMKKHVILLSGDRTESVKAVAEQLNITDYHAELLPQDKVTIITQLLDSGKKVAFIGDGLNDAPVLKLSTLGICMSGLNNDASIQASDLVLSGGNIASLTTAIKAAKKTRSVVSVNIAMSLLVKAIIMILSLTVLPSMWLALVADVGVSLIAILNSVRAIKI